MHWSLRQSSISAKQADSKDMGFAFRCFVDFKSACFFSASRFCCSDANLNAHLSYVTNAQYYYTHLLYFSIWNCTVWWPPYTGGPGQTTLVAHPPPPPPHTHTPSAALLSYICIHFRAAVSYSNLIVFLMHTSLRRTCWRNSGRPLEGRMMTYSTTTLTN